jgi:hypothetical protein
MSLARGINAVDQLFDDRARRQRYQAGGRTEYDRVAEHGRPPQWQGDLRRAHVGRVVDVLDVAERDAFFSAVAAHQERVTDIEHFVDQIEHLLFYERVADGYHQYQHDQKRHIAFEQSNEKEYRKQAKPDDRGDPLQKNVIFEDMRGMTQHSPP